jgi:CHASE3 domain sensor protein
MDYLEEYKKYEQAGHDVFKLICALHESDVESTQQYIKQHQEIEQKKLEIYQDFLRGLK